MLLSRIPWTRSAENVSAFSHQQDIAELVKIAVQKVNILGESAGNVASDHALLLILEHVHNWIEAIPQILPCSQIGQNPSEVQDSEMNSVSAIQVLCMAESLILNLICCLVHAGVTSNDAITQTKAWTTKVLHAQHKHEEMLTRTVSGGTNVHILRHPFNAWLSSIHWLTGVRCC